MTTTLATTSELERTRARWQDGSDTTDRDWLFPTVNGDGRALGFVLDYGPGYYRSPHRYCDRGMCRDCQPGTVLAVVTVADREYVGPSPASWHASVHDARVWVADQIVAGARQSGRVER